MRLPCSPCPPTHASPPPAPRVPWTSIWHAAGDRAADFSWYTKRLILTGVYTTTMLYWLRDASENDEATLAFLDRRLKDVGRITMLRRRVQSGPRFPFRPFNHGNARG